MEKNTKNEWLVYLHRIHSNEGSLLIAKSEKGNNGSVLSREINRKWDKRRITWALTRRVHCSIVLFCFVRNFILLSPAFIESIWHCQFRIHTCSLIFGLFCGCWNTHKSMALLRFALLCQLPHPPPINHFRFIRPNRKFTLYLTASELPFDNPPPHRMAHTGAYGSM